MGMRIGAAWKDLSGRRRRVFAVMAAMATGVALLIIALALFDGLLDAHVSKSLSATSHIVVTPVPLGDRDRDILVDDSDEVVEMNRSSDQNRERRIRSAMSQLRLIERELGERVSAASPYLETEALAVYGTNDAILRVTGVLPLREAEFSDLGRYMKEGSIVRFTNYRNGILLGYTIAERLGVHANDRIRLVALDGTLVPVQVAGVYRFDIASKDEGCFVSFRLAASLAGTLPGEASAIGLKVADQERLDDVVRSVERLTGLKAETWKEVEADSLSVFAFIRNLAVLIPILVIVIASFGIARLSIVAAADQSIASRPTTFDAPLRPATGPGPSQGIMLATFASATGVVIGLVGIAIFREPLSLLTLLPIPFDGSAARMSWNPWHPLIAFAASAIIGAAASLQARRIVGRPIADG